MASSASSIGLLHKEQFPDKSVVLADLLSFLKEANYNFITPSPATHRRVNQRHSLPARSFRDVFGWNRTFEGSILPSELLERLARHNIAVIDSGKWRSNVRISTVNANLFLHSSFPTISADAVFFGPDSYRFVRAIQNHLKWGSNAVRRCLDIGCGSGVGGIVVAQHSSGCEVHLTDINETALNFARINSEFAGLLNCNFSKSDLFKAVTGTFDLIVSNPPYLNDPLKRKYRHGGGELGSEISIEIAKQSLGRLAPGGTLLLYTGSPILNGQDAFHSSIDAHLSGTGFVWFYEEIDPDVFGDELETAAYADADRIAAVVLTVQNPESANGQR